MYVGMNENVVVSENDKQAKSKDLWVWNLIFGLLGFIIIVWEHE